MVIMINYDLANGWWRKRLLLPLQVRGQRVPWPDPSPGPEPVPGGSVGETRCQVSALDDDVQLNYVI